MDNFTTAILPAQNVDQISVQHCRKDLPVGGGDVLNEEKKRPHPPRATGCNGMHRVDGHRAKDGASRARFIISPEGGVVYLATWLGSVSTAHTVRRVKKEAKPDQKGEGSRAKPKR